MAISLLLSVAILLGVIAAVLHTSDRRSKRLFPGPKGWPFIGDLWTTPVYGAVFHFKLLTDKYGPLTETTLLGQRFLLVSSNKIAKELLVDLGKANSGRPCTFAVKDAQSKYGTAEYLPLMSFNDDHHRHKRIGRAYMTAAKVHEHSGHIETEVRRLMRTLTGIQGDPTTLWIRMTEDLTSRVISRLVFGSPEYATRLHHETWQLLIWVSPNGVLPNLIPFLDKLPASCSPWKRREILRHQSQQQWFRQIFNDIRDKLADDTAPPSFMRDHLLNKHNNKSYPSDDDAIKALGMIATAAVFTVSGPIQNIVRALACFPEWQPKLQAELDAVVAFPRLPNLDDLPDLPVLRAFVRETTRWRQAIPSGIPHETEQDVLYQGTCIPAGTAIFALELGLNRDPEVYDHPYDFDPMRWLDPASPNYREPLTKFPSLDNTAMFGHGRRYCMGHELATDEIYLFAMHLIWSFDVLATDSAVFEKNLLPGEQKGGHQWPSKWQEALIIMRPEPVEIQFHERCGRGDVIRAPA